MFELGGEYANIVIQRCQSSFWIDVAKHYKKTTASCLPGTFPEFISENIHYNINIIRDNKTVHVPEWINSGIISVSALISDEGNFLTFDEFQNKYSLTSTNFLAYSGIINAIKQFREKCGLAPDAGSTPSYSKFWSMIRSKEGSKAVYTFLTRPHQEAACIEKWEERFGNLNWKRNI
ncbi:hypothetical protein BaRGS_00039084 [Batillaria attramentaria]|uniref:Uncharacterized protein n=1 Tax=Batillaria attramentaria TaxID=370345 RepID=A0ABD0J413_9CAEN